MPLVWAISLTICRRYDSGRVKAEVNAMGGKTGADGGEPSGGSVLRLRGVMVGGGE